MEIHVAHSAGFCFGVRRAIKIARELAEHGRNACMLGDIVHNETVIHELEHAGIRKLKRLGRGRDATLLIRAHGAAAGLDARARARGYKVVDATCPMVREIHRIAKDMDCRGYRIIVIGDRRHDEVLGIIGQIRRRALVIDTPAAIPWRAVRRIRKAAVVVQSTQNADRVAQIVRALEPRIPELQFFNTICKPTRMKQEEIKSMPLAHDVMIVIGSKTSANTKRLYEIARGLNARSHWIQAAAELKPRWFRNARSVGITAGASTPETTTEAVIARIRSIARRRNGV